MKNIVSLILKGLMWIALLGSFSALGFASENPKMMIPVYFVFFLLVFLGVFLYEKFRKHKKPTSQKSKYFYIVLGVLLILLSLYMPYKSFKDATANSINGFLLIAGTILMVIVGIFTVILINRHKGNNSMITLLGYIIFVILATIPGFVMLKFNSSYGALGSAYYSTLFLSIFAWSGISLLAKVRE